MSFIIKGERNFDRLVSLCNLCGYILSIEPSSFDNGTFVSCCINRINNGVQFTVFSEAFWFADVQSDDAIDVISGMALTSMNIPSVSSDVDVTDSDIDDSCSERIAETLMDAAKEVLPDVKAMLRDASDDNKELFQGLFDVIEASMS